MPEPAAPLLRPVLVSGAVLLLAMAFRSAAPEAPRPPGADRVQAIEAMVDAYHRAGLFNGAVLVATDGQVLFERGVGEANREWHVPNTPDTRFRIGSTTKQFTAALVLRLAEEGKLHLDSTVAAYLPAYPRPQGDQVTLHHLLTHTAGLPNYTSLPGFFGKPARQAHTPAELTALFETLPLDFTPGERWRYSNSGYVLLGQIVEAVTGEPYGVALRRYVLDPLGLADTGAYADADLVERRAAGYVRNAFGYENAPFLDASVPYAAGMLYSTVRDLFRWDQALYDDSLFRDPATKDLFLDTYVDTGTPLGRYGYGWFVGEQFLNGRNVTVQQHGGTIPGFTAAFWRIPEGRHTIVVLDNTMSVKVADLALNLAEILHGGHPSPP